MGWTTTIRELVKNSWKILVDDFLSFFINWEGLYDARLDSSKNRQKISESVRRSRVNYILIYKNFLLTSYFYLLFRLLCTCYNYVSLLKYTCWIPEKIMQAILNQSIENKKSCFRWKQKENEQVLSLKINSNPFLKKEKLGAFGRGYIHQPFQL